MRPTRHTVWYVSDIIRRLNIYYIKGCGLYFLMNKTSHSIIDFQINTSFLFLFDDNKFIFIYSCAASLVLYIYGYCHFWYCWCHRRQFFSYISSTVPITASASRHYINKINILSLILCIFLITFTIPVYNLLNYLLLAYIIFLTFSSSYSCISLNTQTNIRDHI